MLMTGMHRGALGSSIGTGTLAALAGCGIGGPPSDAAMIRHLTAERAAFDGVVAMMTEDRIVGRLVVDALPGGSPDRQARRERYRRLAGRTGCADIIRSPDGRVWFTYRYVTSGGGVAGTGFKDYLYAPTAPSPLRPSLDGDWGARFEDTFRRVDGAWYLYRMRI
jgi:hypothetical protein